VRDAALEDDREDVEWIAAGTNPAMTAHPRTHVSRRRIYICALALGRRPKNTRMDLQGVVAVPGIELATSR
jgi:hypothetical protein